MIVASGCGGDSGSVADGGAVAGDDALAADGAAAGEPGQSLAEHRKSLPPRPTDLTSEVAGNGVRITWDVLMECPVYLVYRATGPTAPDDAANMRLIGASTETEFLDENPPEGTAYYAVVCMNAVSTQSPRSRLLELP